MTERLERVERVERVERAILAERVVAVVRHADADTAREIARACLAGGMRVIEVTFTTPEAAAIVAELRADAPAEAVIGAGTVLDLAEVELALAAGAEFLVSPVTDPEVIAAGRDAGVPTFPGALTPTEVAEARRLGARLVKVFPAGVVGPPFAKAVRSVLPDVRLMPTGGVGEADLDAWLDAGVGAVGIGSELNRAHDAGGGAAVEDLAARLARHATRTTSVTDHP